jgi:hypothetical protein
MSKLFNRLAAKIRGIAGLIPEPRIRETTPFLIEDATDATTTAETPRAGEGSLLDMNVDPIATDDAANIASIDAQIEAALAPLGDPANPFTETLDATTPVDEPALTEAFGLVPAPDVAKSKEAKKEEVVTAAPIEIKPEAAPSLREVFDLINNEVTLRNDTTIAVYERLLAATREELEKTRRNNTIAWSVGGVMSAVAAFGAVWAAGEVSSRGVEVSSLKHQITATQQASAEKEQLRLDLMKIQTATARAEADTLKSRLDQALAITADRDRLRSDLETVKKAKAEIESELRIARAAAAATTQPISSARQAADTVIADAESAQRLTGNRGSAGSDRPDVWSILLNGGDR